MKFVMLYPVLISVIIATRNNILWKFVSGYCLCHCKTFHQRQTPQSAQKSLLPKSVVHYLCHLKSNIIIGQRKTTNKEKYFYSCLTSFNFQLSCT